MQPMSERIDKALGEIAILASQGATNKCYGCDKEQSYVFYLSRVREILKELADPSGPGAIYVQTGNACDVLYDYDENSVQTLLGIKPHDGAFIPLRDPEAMIDVLQKIVIECKKSKEKHELFKVRGNKTAGT